MAGDVIGSFKGCVRVADGYNAQSMGRHGRRLAPVALVATFVCGSYRMDFATPTRSPLRDAAPACPAAEVPCSSAAALRLSGTAALGMIAPDDARLVALRQACAFLEVLEAESESLDQRLEAAKRLDPMRHVLGKTSLESAVDQTRTLIRELDEHLCAAAESARAASRTVARTHPKDIQ